jgi:hypothetical protein
VEKKSEEDLLLQFPEASDDDFVQVAWGADLAKDPTRRGTR